MKKIEISIQIVGKHQSCDSVMYEILLKWRFLLDLSVSLIHHLFESL